MLPAWWPAGSGGTWSCCCLLLSGLRQTAVPQLCPPDYPAPGQRVSPRACTSPEPRDGASGHRQRFRGRAGLVCAHSVPAAAGPSAGTAVSAAPQRLSGHCRAAWPRCGSSEIFQRHHLLPRDAELQGPLAALARCTWGSSTAAACTGHSGRQSSRLTRRKPCPGLWELFLLPKPARESE